MKQALQRFFQRINNIKYAVLFYLLVSSLLSVFMFLKFQGLSSEGVKYANILFYLLTYAGGSLAAITYLYTAIFENKQNAIQNRPALILLRILLIVCIILWIVSAWGFLSEYIFQVIPVLFALALYVALPNYKMSRAKRLKVITSLLMVTTILLPHITAYMCRYNAVSQASSITNPEERTHFLASLVRNISTYNILRSNNDFWKYMLVGTGACLEIATTTKTLLSETGLEARRIGLPGEDHAFNEVKINGTWFVIDSGYGIIKPITREQRAALRLAEFGAISYVIAFTDSSFIELTSFYVPTDTITIRVISENEPVANAQIYLKHEFLSRQLQIPSTDTSFFTGTNGEVTFHLGALTYNESASKYDSFYWIYVNGERTEYKVTSNGTGESHLIEIDLPN